MRASLYISRAKDSKKKKIISSSPLRKKKYELCICIVTQLDCCCCCCCYCLIFLARFLFFPPFILCRLTDWLFFSFSSFPLPFPSLSFPFLFYLWSLKSEV